MVRMTRKLIAMLAIAALFVTSFNTLPAYAEDPDLPAISLPLEGLEAWYKLDDAEGSVSAADSSGNGHHSFNASGTWAEANGVDGGAIALNGTNNMIQLNATGGTFLKGEFFTHSASLWFKANDTTSRQVLYERGGNAAGFAIQLNGNKLEAAVVNASVMGVVSSEFTDTSTWHHVLASFDNGVLKLYLDGQLVDEITMGYAKVASAVNEAAIGARAFVDAFGGSKGGAWFNGMIDEVRIYNTAVVPVAEVVDVTGVSISESNVTLAIGDTRTLTAILDPVFATNKNITWTSSNPAAVTVAPSGLLDAVVQAKSEGTATITVTSEDGGFTATSEITAENVSVEGISLNRSDVTLAANTAYTLTPTFQPANATNRKLFWSSDNEGVATIDQAGTIHAVASGTAMISVTTEDGNFTAATIVRVEQIVKDDKAFLMSYFRSDVAQTGQKDLDLYYSYSRDGVKWYELKDNQPVFEFPDDLRDPFIAKGEDGVWRLLFTSPTLNSDGSNTASNEIGYAESKDLITWTNYKRLDVMKAFKDQGTFVYNSWAPEWSYDSVNEQYVIYWSSTLVNNAPNNNQHYYTTTKDWETFTDARLFFDPGHKTIDVNLYQIGADETINGARVRDKLGVPADHVIPGNDVWFMFYKDETPDPVGMRNRQTWSIEGVAGSDSYQDPAHISAVITPPKNEGATVFKVGDKWHMTYDYWWAGKFGLKTSPDVTDPNAWSEENMDLRIPYRARHSGMTTIDNSEIWNLINNYSLEASYPFNGNAADSSGHQYDGKLIGNPSIVSLNEADSGYAKFNGVGDAIELDHLKDSFYIRSVSMWVKASETERAQMLYHEGNKVNGGFALKIEGNELIAGASKDDVVKTISTAFNDTEWHHVVSIYEEGIIKLYVDGVLKGELITGFQPKQSDLNQDGSAPKDRDPELYDVETTTQTALLGAGSQTDVFGTGSADAYYNGLIGQVKLYSIPLFASDIADLYEANKETYDFELEQAAYDVTFTIRDGAANAMDGAAVTVTKDVQERSVAEAVYSGITDAEGKVKLQLSPGSYNYSVTKAVYSAIAGSFEVVNQAEDIQVVMHKAPNPGEAPIIVGIKPIEEIRVLKGSVLTQVQLPTVVSAVYNDASSILLPVEWDTSSLNLSIAGEYDLEGTVAGLNGIKAGITVVVYESESPTTPTTPTSPTTSTSPSVGNPTPEAPKPVVNPDGTVSVRLEPAKGEGNTANVKVGSSVLNQAFAEAKEGEDGIKKVILNVTETDSADNYVLELPSAAVSAESKDKLIEFATPLGTIILPENMLRGNDLNGEDSVQFSLGRADTANVDNAIRTQIGSRPVVELQVTAGDKTVSWNNPQAPVTVLIAYTPTSDELKDPEHIVVWYVDAQGEVQSVPSGRYDAEMGTVVFSTTHFSKYAVAYVKKSFNDTGKYPWAQKPIQVLASKGIINGVNEAAFAPGKHITRADFMLLLVKTLDLKAEFSLNFADVDQGVYYYEALGIAKALRIADGIDASRFHPNDPISRQDMMVLTARALEKYGHLEPANSEAILDSFKDKAQISSYARESVTALVEKGLIEGAGNVMNPKSDTTRAEAAVFLYQVYNKVYK